MKAIMLQITIAGLKAAQYNKVWEDLREAGHEHPKGLLNHYAGVTGENWLIIEIWESEEALNEFGKILNPLLEKNSVPKMQVIALDLYYTYEQTATRPAEQDK